MYHFETKKDLVRYIQDQVLTTAEVMEILGVTRQNITRLVKKGDLKPIKEGSVKLYLREEVEELKTRLEKLREQFRPYDHNK
ncbi:helix-turn-helix domain-containing protein [Melghirimyces algeriensis]|uniref:Helix-turn-helix domain-containing protein n=1 Tax=Melghirimyces algeriensis TaxID=910412 RepID=A0A521CJH2_9BACL|nr:helix-turn-helix domain-containing protein [Melghirimyces algeriensis]SMO59607.1 Helix-turn-helix domain-containing protein [Melghirimyces algeriensis]